MHPVWMVVGLALAVAGLRVGMQLRRRRVAGARRTPGLVVQHMRIARPAVVVLLSGFVGGPLSAWWLRDWTPFGTFHAWVGGVAGALFLAAGLIGLRLSRGEAASVEVHGWIGLAAVLLGLVGAVAGFVLLP